MFPSFMVEIKMTKTFNSRYHLHLIIHNKGVWLIFHFSHSQRSKSIGFNIWAVSNFTLSSLPLASSFVHHYVASSLLFGPNDALLKIQNERSALFLWSGKTVSFHTFDYSHFMPCTIRMVLVSQQWSKKIRKWKTDHRRYVHDDLQ